MQTIRCINCMKIMDENAALCSHCGYGQEEGQLTYGVKPGTILRERYTVGRGIGGPGMGYFRFTYVGYDLTLECKVVISEYFPIVATRHDTIPNYVQWTTKNLDTVQIKILKDHFKEKCQEGCEGFLREARRMEKLDPLPGIARVRDTFEENQTAYIIMDYIEGETLKQKLMKTGIMKFTECICLLRPVMESLEKMHRQGFIHSNINPDNIMIQPDGSACLLDFDAAKDLFQDFVLHQLVMKFTPLSDSIKGNTGSWTDVYSLCATIYYCVTGKVVPDALNRMFEDTLTFDLPMSEPLSEAVISALRDGLEPSYRERIQTVGILLERLQGAKAETSSRKFWKFWEFHRKKK